MKKIDIENFKLFLIKNINTNTSKNNILSIIKDRICHHRVRFLNILINYFKGDVLNYLEIGVHNGCSMGYVLQSDYKINNCYGIDLFENTFYKDKLNKNKIYSRLNQLNKNKNNIHLIKGNSCDKKIIEHISDKVYDLIFIDGDHRYEGVKKDFYNYYELLSDNGIMVFDDYNLATNNSGVYKFISEELLNNKKYFRGYYKFYDNTHKNSKYKDGIIMFYK